MSCCTWCQKSHDTSRVYILLRLMYCKESHDAFRVNVLLHLMKRGKRLTCAHKTETVAHTGFHWILTHLRTQKWLSCTHRALWGWGGVRWGGVITFMFLCTHTGTATLSSFLLSADAGTTLSWSVTSGVGWGGVITFMFLCTHRHSNLH